MKKIFSTLLVLAVVAVPSFAGADTITAGDMQGWAFVQETATGSGSLVGGPIGGLGNGSVNLVVDSTGGVIIGKAHIGTKLSDITKLEYSTFRAVGGPALAIALQMNFDADVTDLNNAWQGRLVYEPYHTQTVNTGVWQTWDTLNDAAGSGTGNWWFSNGALSATCSMANPCTWTEVVTAFPNGGIHPTLGAVIFKAGGGWAGGFDGNVDALTIGVSNVDTTYDFEVSEVTEIVTGDTAAGENQPGWMFNRDVTTATPYVFNNDEQSIGSGSIYVLPIGANASDKFIAENFINTAIADINSISYDFMIASTSAATQEEHFYMSVYANFGASDDLKFYDCRYSVVPTTGSNVAFTTVIFDPTQAYPVTTHGSSQYSCPSVPADMDTLSAGSNIRAFSLNVGDTSVNDVGLNGYLDNVVTNLDSVVTIYDFEDGDVDNDGVDVSEDICPNTDADNTPSFNKTNGRYMWTGTTWDSTTKGANGFIPTMEYTYGCSGDQIIAAYAAATGESVDGLYKYGITKGLLETWHEGVAKIETVTVPATATSGINSLASLIAGQDYVLRASGTADAADGIEFDADYSFRAATSITWTDAVSTYEYLTDNLLDLKVDDAFVQWDNDAVYNADHTYNMDFIGTGAPVSFGIYDVAPENNSGSLTVDIFAKLW